MLLKTIKKPVKKLLQRGLPISSPPLLVASMGRSGSTLVYDALRRAVSETYFRAPFQHTAMRIISDSSWDVKNQKFTKGVVYKTHALAHELGVNPDVKVVFLFGSASDAALSVFACKEKYGERWIKRHFEHLRADGDFEELGTRDVLRFSEQLDGWIGLRGTKRIVIHYDALWDNVDLISEFVGVPVVLPPRRERSGPSSAEEEIRLRYKKTYAELDERICTLPKCQILD